MGWFDERAEFTEQEIVSAHAFVNIQYKRTYYCQFPDAIRPLDMFTAYRVDKDIPDIGEAGSEYRKEAR